MKQEVQLITPTDGGDINAILSDFRWLVVPDQPLVLEYSFYDVDSDFFVDARYGYDPDDRDYDLPFREGFRSFDAAEQAAVRAIFADLEHIVPIDFVEVADSASSEIRLGFTDLGVEASDGLAFLPDAKFFPFEDATDIPHETSELSGDVWLDINVTDEEFTEVLLHEIGHTLGLSHSFVDGFQVLDGVTNTVLDPDLDFTGNTVLSYSSAPETIPRNDLISASMASTFMLLDIAALQHLYGEATLDSSDDVYVVQSPLAAPVDVASLGYADFQLHRYSNSYITVNDGGGANALVVDIRAPLRIDISQGGWNYTSGGIQTTGFDDENLYFSADTLFRDVHTSGGNDTIIGNALANHFFTGAGFDVVYGGAGDDFADLGERNDRYFYAGGNDHIVGGDGIDTVDLGELSYSHFKFFLYGNEATINAIAGPTTIELSGVERVIFADRQFTLATFQSDIASANRNFIVNDEVPLYLSAIGDEFGQVNATEAQVYRLYYGGLGRAPDRGGYEFWLEKITSATYNFAEVAARFIDSPEFSGLADVNADGVIADAEFLDHMYFNVFGRQPDEGGYNWWLDQLESGDRSQEEAFSAMAQSDEFVLLTAATVNDFLFV